MEQESMKKIIDNVEEYDIGKEDTFRTMLSDFYNRKMLTIIIVVWTFGVISMLGAVYCGIQFFKAQDTQSQIMYAVIFICCYQTVGLMKIFAWQNIHKNGIKREIKRLELRVAELSKHSS